MSDLYLSEANARITARGAGGIDLGAFRELEGGDLAYEPFMVTDEQGNQIAQPSLQGARSQVVVRRAFKKTDWTLKQQVERALASGSYEAEDGVTAVAIDGRKIAFGDPDQYDGVLLSATRSNISLANGTTEMMFVVTFAVSRDLAT